MALTQRDDESTEASVDSMDFRTSETDTGMKRTPLVTARGSGGVVDVPTMEGSVTTFPVSTLLTVPSESLARVDEIIVASPGIEESILSGRAKVGFPGIDPVTSSPETYAFCDTAFPDTTESAVEAEAIHGEDDAVIVRQIARAFDIIRQSHSVITVEPLFGASSSPTHQRHCDGRSDANADFRQCH